MHALMFGRDAIWVCSFVVFESSNKFADHLLIFVWTWSWLLQLLQEEVLDFDIVSVFFVIVG